MSGSFDRVTIELRYSLGSGEAERGIFRNTAIEPDHSDELSVAIRRIADGNALADNPEQLQVHLIGTSRALESLGCYLIALARLSTTDPEPYGSLDDVRNVDGGTLRLLPRRIVDNAVKPPN
jgi:hypothetical protein